PMTPMPGKVGRPGGVWYISHEAENGIPCSLFPRERPTAGFTALRHLIPAHCPTTNWWESLNDGNTNQLAAGFDQGCLFKHLQYPCRPTRGFTSGWRQQNESNDCSALLG